MNKARIDIEHLLIWAYRDQQIRRTAGLLDVAAGRKAPRLRSATAVLNDVAALGTRVDSSPLRLVATGADADDDAFMVHDAVLKLPSSVMVLIIQCGESGGRPPFHGWGADHLVREMAGSKPRMVRGLGGKPVMCLLRYREDLELVRHSRGEYMAWWDALDGLAADLAGALARHEPLAPAAPREPWLTPPLVYVD